MTRAQKAVRLLDMIRQQDAELFRQIQDFRFKAQPVGKRLTFEEWIAREQAKFGVEKSARQALKHNVGQSSRKGTRYKLCPLYHSRF